MIKKRFYQFASTILLILIWVGIKYIGEVPDRYLPSPYRVIEALYDIGLPILYHIGITMVRVVLGFVVGTVLGVAICLYTYQLGWLQFLTPTANALRAVPPVALVPFFLLWFGFSETGRILLLLLGMGINVFIASSVALLSPTERDRILFLSFPVSKKRVVWRYWLPRILESLLPTLRFGLSTIIGLVVVAEMLGAQSGLGYLIQTSRATFSLHVIMLSVIFLGVITVLLDKSLSLLWKRIIFWKP